MKAFSFRLDQVLRWREMQVTVQESRLAAAAARLAEIRASIEARNRELSAAASSLANGLTGADLAAYSEFRRRTRLRIRDLESQAQIAQQSVALERTRLVDANRKRKLIENLKGKARTAWRREYEGELSAFADEAFLARLQR